MSRQQQTISPTALIQDFSCAFVIADKGYEADAFVAQIQAQGTTAMIPLWLNRKEQRDYDKHLYRERHLVGGFINKLKLFRRAFPALTSSPRTI